MTTLEVVLPVLNEERDLGPSARRLHQYLTDHLGSYDWRILIADNGSTDATLDVAEALSAEHLNVDYIRLEQRGRGQAISRAWRDSDADILAYMDVDLSTELSALPRLLDAVDGGGYEIAIASRLKKGARVIGRPPQRELISRVYSLLLRVVFRAGVRDFQCGFKAITRRAARDLLPLVEDTGWFFDSELLLLAARSGYSISEVPVQWTDDPDSRVRVYRTAVEDLKGVARLRFGGLRRASRALEASRRR